jgi:hypothetical protein
MPNYRNFPNDRPWPKIASDEVFSSVGFGEIIADGFC